MHWFYRTVYGAICGLILFWGFAAQIFAADSGLTEVLSEKIEVYPISAKPLTIDCQIKKGTAIPNEKLNDLKTALKEDLDLIPAPEKLEVNLKMRLEVRKKTGERYWLREGTYKLAAGNYKVTIPIGAKVDPVGQGFALAQDLTIAITPPKNSQITLTVDPQTIVERIPGASGTGTTLQVQPSQAPPGGYINLEVAKSDFDFTKAQFHVSLRKSGGNNRFIASDDVELKEVQIGKAKLQARIPPVPGIGGVDFAKPVDLLVVARGPDDKRAEVLSKEFKISSGGLAIICWAMAFFIPWAVAAFVKGEIKDNKRKWRRNPIWFVAGKDGGASLSLAQILLWTILVFSASFYVLVASGKLLDLTNDVLLLLGIAGGASVIAKIAASAKDAKGAVIAKVTAAPTETEPKWLDLLQTDGQADLYKFQMALFTLLAAVFVAFKIYGTFEFPVLPAGLLTLIGISNGVYLASKGTTKTEFENLGEKFDELNKAKEELEQRKAEADKAATELQKAQNARDEAKKKLDEIQKNLTSESDPAKQGDLKRQLEQQQRELTAAEDRLQKAGQKQKDAPTAMNAAQSRVQQLQNEFNALKDTIKL